MGWALDSNRMKAIKRQHPESIPLSVGILPAAWIKYREAFDEIVKAHPVIFGPQNGQGRDYDAVGGTYVAGEHVDAWGCVWSNIKTGRESIVTGHPVPRREMVHTLKPPEKDAGFPHGFMWLRLADLRGFTELMIDFAEEPPELQQLIDIVLQYNLRQTALAIRDMKKEDDIFHFGDDLGMQNGLAIDPRLWRKYLKPCFTQIYKPFRDAGKQVYMHTDGHIIEIIPDLIEAGVTVVNPQVRANGLEKLAKVAKSKVCIDLDLDRQLFPFCKPKDIDEHIHEAVATLGAPEGGLWLKAEIDDGVPLENIEAIFAALEKYRGYFAN
jgi:uroporphyrinogen decarboxylase